MQAIYIKLATKSQRFPQEIYVRLF